MERYHVMLGQLGFDSCVVITADYCSESDAILNKETLYPALRYVIREHGALGAQISTGGKTSDVPQFVRLPIVDLDLVVEFREDNTTTTDELLRTELERQFQFNSPDPPWHLTVVGGRSVVFAYHHVIADGQSGPAFLHSLLSALNTTSADKLDYENIVTVSPHSVIIGPTETYTNISPSLTALLHEVYKMIVPASWTDKPYAWTGNPIPPMPSLEMTVRCWEISTTYTTQILNLCRENHTTLTAFLYTLVVGVLSRVVATYPTEPTESYRTISAVVAVSLRRFTGVSPFVLCDQVCSTQSYVPMHTVGRDKEGIVYFPWAVTKQFGARIQGAVEKSRETLGMLGLLFWLGMAESYFLGMLGKKRETGLTISNLGKFPASQATHSARHGSWTLKSVYFAQCDVVRGAAIKMNVIGSPSGTTNVTFTWGQQSIDTQLAEIMIKEVQDVLYAMLT